MASSDSLQHQSTEVMPRLFAGRYAPVRLLGIGGQKVVYLAHDQELQRDCALGVVDPGAMGAEEVQRLRDEARAMARFGPHPNLVTVFDIGVHEGRPFIVSEYVAGGDLRSELARAGGAVSARRAASISRDVLAALSVLHDRGLVHRDIKPDNVWIAADGTAKLGDLGVALSREHANASDIARIVGTPAYMAPEQIRGDAVDGRADLYALGCLLYELLTGAPPFRGTVASILGQHLRAVPLSPCEVNPSIPPIFEAFILSLLSKEPESRISTAARAAAMVQEVLAATLGSAPASAVGRGAFRQGLSPSPYTGRDPELAAARAAFDNAQRGAGSFFVVAGEPGIGKSRFCEELALHARLRLGRVLVGRCSDTDGALPYLPFAEVLDAAADEHVTDRLRAASDESAAFLAGLSSRIGEKLGGGTSAQGAADTDRIAAFQAVVSLLKAVASADGLLVILEDLHWADRSTLLLLKHLARQLQEMRILVVGTYRHLEVGAQHPLSQMLSELRRERLVDRISLGPLSQNEVRDLVAGSGQRLSPSVTDRIVRMAEGNPLFVEEVLRQLIESREPTGPSSSTGNDAVLDRLGVPEGARSVIEQRISGLSTACARMLTKAAAIRGAFRWDVLCAISGETEDDLLDLLDEALLAHVIRERPDAGANYEFTHALIRQVLYERLSTPRRMRLHGQIGEALEKLPGAEAERHVAELAFHYCQASSPERSEKALFYSRRAAEQAMESFAYGEAALHGTRALALVSQFERDPAARKETELALKADRAEAFARMASWSEARPDLEAVLAGADPNDKPRRARLNARLAETCFWALDVPSTLRFAAATRELAVELGDVELEAYALGWLAIGPQVDGDLDGTIAGFARARERTTEYPLSMVLESAALYWRGDYEESVVSTQKAFAVAEKNKNFPAQLIALPHMGLSLAALGRYAEAEDVFEKGRQLGRRYSVRTMLARTLSMSAGYRFDVYDFARAEELAEQALDLARSIEFVPPAISSLLDLVLCAARRGEVSRAEARLPLVYQAMGRVAGWHRWVWAMRLSLAEAEIALAREDWELAIVKAGETDEHNAKPGRKKYAVMTTIVRGQALARLGRRGEAVAMLEQAVTRAREIGEPPTLLRALATLCRIEPTDERVFEARQTVHRIQTALFDGEARSRFASAAVVLEVGR